MRHFDENGFLHVDVSPVTAVQVAPYRGSEIPGWRERGLDPDRVYHAYRPAAELSKPATVESLNGIPIQLEHHPDYAKHYPFAAALPAHARLHGRRCFHAFDGQGRSQQARQITSIPADAAPRQAQLCIVDLP